MDDALVGRTAVELAQLVRDGVLDATDVVRAHLGQVAALDPQVGAFQVVRAERARAEAAAVSRRPDLGTLPLAGVPVAIKDSISVAGEPMRVGSLATSPAPSTQDHELVRRLRAAGAIVIGKTRVPELCIWGWTDGAFGIARNPWNLDRTPGGSSGGSAASVSAAMVPIAHGSDGGGSIRIPSAACGLVGIKPGSDIVPGDPGSTGWCGLSCNGPLATTVADLALTLSVMAGRPELADVTEPAVPLRIAVSVVSPMPGVKVDPAYEAAALETGALLARAGHSVTPADPPYRKRTIWAAAVRSSAGIAQSAQGLKRSSLERRSRPMVRAGRIAARLVRDGDRESWRQATAAFFEDYDVLVTPALAGIPPVAEGWSRKSFLANTRAAPFGAFTGVWNVAGYPAAAVPAGFHPTGMPLSIQLVAPDGRESLLLGVAKQLERLRPWPRHAPMSGAR